MIWRRTGHASQTLVVLHLWAQGLEEGDVHPPMLSLLVDFTFNDLNITNAFVLFQF